MTGITPDRHPASYGSVTERIKPDSIHPGARVENKKLIDKVSTSIKNAIDNIIDSFDRLLNRPTRSEKAFNQKVIHLDKALKELGNKLAAGFTKDMDKSGLGDTEYDQLIAVAQGSKNELESVLKEITTTAEKIKGVHVQRKLFSSVVSLAKEAIVHCDVLKHELVLMKRESGQIREILPEVQELPAMREKYKADVEAHSKLKEKLKKYDEAQKGRTQTTGQLDTRKQMGHQLADLEKKLKPLRDAEEAEAKLQDVKEFGGLRMKKPLEVRRGGVKKPGTPVPFGTKVPSKGLDAGALIQETRKEKIHDEIRKGVPLKTSSHIAEHRAGEKMEKDEAYKKTSTPVELSQAMRDNAVMDAEDERQNAMLKDATAALEKAKTMTRQQTIKGATSSGQTPTLPKSSPPPATKQASKAEVSKETQKTAKKEDNIAIPVRGNQAKPPRATGSAVGLGQARKVFKQASKSPEGPKPPVVPKK